MKTIWVWACVAVFAAALVVSREASAQAADKAAQPTVKALTPAAATITFVGRGNRAAVVGKDGNVTELAPEKLVVKNRSKRAVAAPAAPTAAAEPAKPAEEKSAEDAAKAAKEEGEKAVNEALKEADVKTIEEMKNSKSMWFFDETGKVMTQEELDKRLADKDFAGIKAVNDDRAEWTPRSAKSSPESSVPGPEGEKAEKTN